MTKLSREVTRLVTERVRLVYITGDIAQWWNHRREPDEPITFSGHYWVDGLKEAGPFKSKSAAIRDAYYTVVMRIDVPAVGAQVRPVASRGRRGARRGEHRLAA